MALRYLRLPLFNDTLHSYSINLEGNNYLLEFLFIERIQGWVTTLKNSEQNVLVSGQRLTPNTDLFADYSFENLTGFFFYTPVSDIDPEYLTSSPKEHRDVYKLFYVYDDGT